MHPYLELIEKEIRPAFGCTEPIALAFTAAKAVEVLGEFPENIQVNCSGNMIKNAKSVTIPNSEGKVGIEYSVILGALVGTAKAELEVLEAVTAEDVQQAIALYEREFCHVALVPDVENLYIEVIAQAQQNQVKVVVQEKHTNIVLIEKNGVEIFSRTMETSKAFLLERSFNDIFEFADKADIDRIIPILDRQIEYNMAIAVEGLQHDYGSNLGKLILAGDKTLGGKARAYAAAASDARMGGCSMPVMINSGSGNQGITVSVPIIIYAQEMEISQERLYRSLVLANLLALYQKQEIGRLSAYCGAISASAAAVVGIAYLLGEEKEVIEETLVNALAAVAGVICDGAKASCAAKINIGLTAAFLGYEQAKSGNSFKAHDGIVKDDINQTIAVVSEIAKVGMKETDIVVLNKMLEK